MLEVKAREFPNKRLFRCNNLTYEVNRPGISTPFLGQVELIKDNMESTKRDKMWERVESRKAKFEDLKPVLSKSVESGMLTIRKEALAPSGGIVQPLGLKQGDHSVPRVRSR